MSVHKRLAEILDDYTAILTEIEGSGEKRQQHAAVPGTTGPRVLMPADQQRGCTPPTIADPDQTLDRRRRGWLR